MANTLPVRDVPVQATNSLIDGVLLDTTATCSDGAHVHYTSATSPTEKKLSFYLFYNLEQKFKANGTVTHLAKFGPA